MQTLKGLTVCIFLFVVIGILAFSPGVFAQEKNEDIVYLKGGTAIRGTILNIKMDLIRIRLPDGSISEYDRNEVIKFSSSRPFREIYERPEINANPNDSQPARGAIGFNFSYASIADDKWFSFEDVPFFGLTLTAFLDDYFSLVLEGGYLKTDVNIDLPFIYSGNIGDLTQISIAASVLFHAPLYNRKIWPYFGVGAGYYFNDFDQSPTVTILLPGIKASVDDSFGFLVKAGVEFFIIPSASLNLEFSHVWSEAEGKISGGPSVDIDLNTTKAGIGLKFYF